MDAVLSGKDCEYYALSLDGDETLDQTERDGFLAEDIRPQRQQASAGQLFTCSLIALIVGALAGFLGTGWRANTCPAACDPATSLCEAGIDQHSPIPQEVFLNRKHVPFIPHREYMGPSKEAARNWKHLTAGADSIYLSDPSKYGLDDPGIKAPFFLFHDPPLKAAEDKDNLLSFYVLNNLHELHCIHTIRLRYNDLVYDAANTTPLASNPLDMDWIDHMEHCFEYLRLSVTCGDYMTFETDSPPGSPREYWEDGLSWGVVHSCIDWDALMDWQHKMVVAYNQTWAEGDPE